MQSSSCLSSLGYTRLRQSLAEVIDSALETYWTSMRSPEPDAILLAAQAEVCVNYVTHLPCNRTLVPTSRSIMFACNKAPV